MLTAIAREYPILALETAPRVMSVIVSTRNSTDPVWDFRLDPERFTLREAIAHVADWDEVYLARLQRTVNEDQPILPRIDEVAMAIDRDYAHQDVFENITRWEANRTILVAYIRSLSNDVFSRTSSNFLGEISIDGWIARMVGHDMYHIRQVLDYFDEFSALNQ